MKSSKAKSYLFFLFLIIFFFVFSLFRCFFIIEHTFDGYTRDDCLRLRNNILYNLTI